MAVETLWEEYRRGKTAAVKERLLLTYLPLVRKVVARLEFGLPPHLDREDLAAYGILGLMQALESFDPGRGVKFESYASLRIRGEVLDQLRRQQWLPRSVTDRIKEVQRAQSKLEQEWGREATNPELARATGFKEEEIDELWRLAAGQAAISLDAFLQDDEATRVGELLADAASPDPGQSYEEQELLRLLEEAVARLPERDQLLLSLYYHEGLTLKEIGAVLEVTESRVCQLHARALTRLRQYLREWR